MGGQGLQIFRKGKPIENFLYKDMANWTSDVGGVLVVEVASRELRYTTPDHSAIVDEMTAAATALAETIKAAQEERIAADDTQVGDRLRAVEAGGIREGISVRSKTQGMLHRDSVIEVLEVGSERGVVRVRFSGGWVSKTKEGTSGETVLLEKVVGKGVREVRQILKLKHYKVLGWG